MLEHTNSVAQTTVRVVNKSCFDLPEYKTENSIGMDLYFDINRMRNYEYLEAVRKYYSSVFVNDRIRKSYSEKEKKDVEYFMLNPGQTVLFPTGIFIEPLYKRLDCQIRPRSSMGMRHIIQPNSPGTVDPDYRGELLVPLRNIDIIGHEIFHGDRIAQFVISVSPIIVWEELKGEEDFTGTVRDKGSFGHTGR
jgi:dUTP pyrophosphatase